MDGGMVKQLSSLQAFKNTVAIAAQTSMLRKKNLLINYFFLPDEAFGAVGFEPTLFFDPCVE